MPAVVGWNNDAERRRFFVGRRPTDTGAGRQRGGVVEPRKHRSARQDPQIALGELETVAARLSLPVRYVKGEMRGGLCRLRNQWQIIINADLADDEKAEVLAESLAQTELDNVYVSPRVRQLLEQVRGRARESEKEWA